MLLDFKDLDKTDRYKIMSRTVTPRPIAWIVTEGNVAPFSYYTPLSSEPAAVIVAIGHRRDGTPKDTLRNLRETGKCTICTVSEEHLEAMHLTGTDLAPEIDEAEHFNLPTQTVEEGYPPVIRGASAAFFCTLLKEVELEGSATIPVILRIEKAWFAPGVMEEGYHLALENVGRVGKSYCATNRELPVPGE